MDSQLEIGKKGRKKERRECGKEGRLAVSVPRDHLSLSSNFFSFNFHEHENEFPYFKM